MYVPLSTTPPPLQKLFLSLSPCFDTCPFYGVSRAVKKGFPEYYVEKHAGLSILEIVSELLYVIVHVTCGEGFSFVGTKQFFLCT